MYNDATNVYPNDSEYYINGNNIDYHITKFI